MVYWFHGLTKALKAPKASESDKFIRESFYWWHQQSQQSQEWHRCHRCHSWHVFSEVGLSLFVITATTNSFVNIPAYLTPNFLSVHIYDSMVLYLRSEWIGLQCIAVTKDHSLSYSRHNRYRTRAHRPALTALTVLTALTALTALATLTELRPHQWVVCERAFQ